MDDTSVVKTEEESSSCAHRLFTREMGNTYLVRSGFLSKSEGVLDLLDEELCRIGYLVVKNAMSLAAEAGQKSIRRQHIEEAVRSIPELNKPCH